MDRSLQNSPLRPSSFRGSIFPGWYPFFIRVPPDLEPDRRVCCDPDLVVKLKFSSDDKSDSGTNAYVKQVVNRAGLQNRQRRAVHNLERQQLHVKVIILSLAGDSELRVSREHDVDPVTHCGQFGKHSRQQLRRPSEFEGRPASVGSRVQHATAQFERRRGHKVKGDGKTAATGSASRTGRWRPRRGPMGRR